MTDADYYDDENEYDEDVDGDNFGDCCLMADGQCLKAGSEECDWECPHAHGPFYAGSEAWGQRHDAGVPIDGCECSECETARGKEAKPDAAEASFRAHQRPQIPNALARIHEGCCAMTPYPRLPVSIARGSSRSVTQSHGASVPAVKGSKP